MKTNEYGKAFSRYFFKFQKTAKRHFDNFVDKNVEREKRTFYKKYGVEPKEEDIKEMKKDIVMGQGLVMFFIVVIILIAIKLS